MQDYTPLGSTATTTVKDGILNHEKNINALRSTYSGTAFPTENLVAGLKCYRTDLKKTYTYNGEMWDDSVNTASLTVSGETSVPTPATENNSKTIANTEFVHGVVNNLVNGAPTALDTLQELATALGNDPNFSTTILNKIGEKENKTDAQIEHKKLQNAIDSCLESKPRLTYDASNSNNPVTIPFKKGMYTLNGMPDGKFSSGDEPTRNYAVIANFKGTEGGMFSLYAVDGQNALYYRTGWDNDGWRTYWHKIATTDAIPTKVSQLLNDSGYQKTAEIPVVSQTQNGYMSKSDKAKLDGIAEGATNVTDYVQSVTESNGKVTVTKGGGESTTFNAGLNILARNKAYAAGDIAYSPNLPSYLYLECMTAGITGATEPNISTLSSGAKVNDGTAQFSVKTVCAKEYVDAVNTHLQAQFDKIQIGLVPIRVVKQSNGEYGGEVDVDVNYNDTFYQVQLTLSMAAYFGDAALASEIVSSKKMRIHLWFPIKNADEVTTIQFYVNWLTIHK